MLSFAEKTLKIAARSSPLSKIQVEEVLSLLHLHQPSLDYSIHYFTTPGDRDLKSSLRGKERTDFFTKDLDQALLDALCDVAIHSAKDLPDPLPEGLEVICLTEGLDSSDSLVISEGLILENLPPFPLIATCSERRETLVLKLLPQARFCDLRGTIGQRLEKLENGECQGVVVAEAALLRLGLTHLNRFSLPGPTVEGQGRLAVVALKGKERLRRLFSPFDSRKRD